MRCLFIVGDAGVTEDRLDLLTGLLTDRIECLQLVRVTAGSGWAGWGQRRRTSRRWTSRVGAVRSVGWVESGSESGSSCAGLRRRAMARLKIVGRRGNFCAVDPLKFLAHQALGRLQAVEFGVDGGSCVSLFG